MATEEKFVLGLDVGTTTIRAFVFDQNGSLRGSSTDKVRTVLLFQFTYVDTYFNLIMTLLNRWFCSIPILDGLKSRLTRCGTPL